MRVFLPGVLVLLAATGCGGAGQVVKVVVQGESRALRERAPGEPASSPGKPKLLVLALDGIDRHTLYGMLERRELPELGALLGQSGARLDHAYLAPNVLSALPSTTGIAWATELTGVRPAVHGFMGNEFFIREKRQLAAPIPVSVDAAALALSVFTEGYANDLLPVPTVYESMRERDPEVSVWVSMSQFYRGADRLLTTRTSVIASAFEAFLEGASEKAVPRRIWEELDTKDVDVVVDALAKDRAPDVLTVYLFGTDEWAHIAPGGPDEARRSYLREVVDPQLGKLRRQLAASGDLADRYVVVIADHGHTEVVHDEVHALSTRDVDDPPGVLKGAGYRVRPFEAEVKDDDPFQSVLAYQGAIAYVYLADRSTCADGKRACDWSRPPRYAEDVVPAAEAFYRNNLDGAIVPAMRGALDMVLTRRPVPYAEDDLPFEVYVGDGKTQPVAEYLAAHPHPTYVAFASRLADLGVGPRGERAGDVLLLAHNGDRETPAERYYFASPYHSWHGSPSARDSDIPVIVAHPSRSTAELEALTVRLVGAEPRAQDVGRLLVGLRLGADALPPRTPAKP